jgi:hypothetical protein
VRLSKDISTRGPPNRRSLGFARDEQRGEWRSPGEQLLNGNGEQLPSRSRFSSPSMTAKESMTARNHLPGSRYRGGMLKCLGKFAQGS